MTISTLLQEGQDLRKLTQDFLNKSIAHQKPVIVAWGLMNAGKSYLLNMLTQHIDKEFFKTNDFRETVDIKTCETEQYVYLDTPGLDANTKDNLEALKGVKKADVVLFVHQLQGELEAIEIEFLKDVKESFGQYAAQNIILILSKIDKEDGVKVAQIEKRVLEQCENNLGFKPKCFQVSNEFYKHGIQNHEKDLIGYSHIEDLRQCIDEVIKNTQEVRQERAKQEKAQLLKQLNDHKQKLEREHKDKTFALKNSFVPFQDCLNNFKQSVDVKAQQYKNI